MNTIIFAIQNETVMGLFNLYQHSKSYENPSFSYVSGTTLLISILIKKKLTGELVNDISGSNLNEQSKAFEGTHYKEWLLMKSKTVGDKNFEAFFNDHESFYEVKIKKIIDTTSYTKKELELYKTFIKTINL